MRRIVQAMCLCMFGFLVGCGGGVIDDTQSTYEPTINVNETIADEADFKFVLTEIVQKTHPDVGRIVEISFEAENKTDEAVYVTSENLHFDGEEISEVHLAFFERLEPETTTTIVTYVQEMEGQELKRLEGALSMELQVITEDGSDVIASYPVEINF